MTTLTTTPTPTKTSTYSNNNSSNSNNNNNINNNNNNNTTGLHLCTTSLQGAGGLLLPLLRCLLDPMTSSCVNTHANGISSCLNIFPRLLPLAKISFRCGGSQIATMEKKLILVLNFVKCLFRWEAFGGGRRGCPHCHAWP